MSIDVRTARRADWSIHRPETPTPVPISMIDSALIAAVTTANCAPMAGETGPTPRSWGTPPPPPPPPQLRPNGGRDRLDTEFVGDLSRARDTVRFDDLVVNELPVQFLVRHVYSPLAVMPTQPNGRSECSFCGVPGVSRELSCVEGAPSRRTQCDAHRREASLPRTCTINLELSAAATKACILAAYVHH